MDAVPRPRSQAIRLYAEQAARGSSSGHVVLRWPAGRWASERARALIDDPVSQGLLVSYALARLGDIVDGQPDSAFDAYANFDATGQPGLADSARRAQCRAQSHAQVPGIGPAGAGRAAGGQRRPRRRPGLSHRPLRPGAIAGQPVGHGAGLVGARKLALRQGDSVQAAQAMPAPPPRSRAPMAASTPTARDVCGPNRAC